MSRLKVQAKATASRFKARKPKQATQLRAKPKKCADCEQYLSSIESLQKACAARAKETNEALIARDAHWKRWDELWTQMATKEVPMLDVLARNLEIANMRYEGLLILYDQSTRRNAALIGRLNQIERTAWLNGPAWVRADLLQKAIEGR